MTPPILGFLLMLAGSAISATLIRHGHRTVGVLALLAAVVGLVAAALTDTQAAYLWILGGVVGTAIGHAFLWRKQSRRS